MVQAGVTSGYLNAPVLVTGANGFVGQAVCEQLAASGRACVRALRLADGGPSIAIGNIDGNTDWRAALAGCDVVIHLAARVHVMHDTAADPLAEFRAVNTAGTLNLARQAAQAGIRRFIFLSTVKVNGESGHFSERDQAAPQDAYACSKHEAEDGLHEIARNTGMEMVILRPPLVYGPGVGANFLSLIRAIDRGLPLPLGRIRNQRSLIYRGNLASAIMACLDHPAAVGKTYLVSDGDDVSTTELIRRIAAALHRLPRLLPVPPGLMRILSRCLGKQAAVDRLLGSLSVDSGAICRDLGWRPPFSMQAGLTCTIDWYRHKDGSC